MRAKRSNPAVRALLTFLGRAYKYKELSDYAVDRAAMVTDADASALMRTASGFLAEVTERLGSLDEG